MGKRRRCPVCRSREWHKEPSSGLITCSEGHVLQNYRNETTETTELGPHTLRKRTLKSNRTVRTHATKADDQLYHGARARYLYFECLQLILRMQVVALTATWSLPSEFEIVCRDLWAVHLSLLPRPPPAEPYLHAQDLGGGKSDADGPGRSRSLNGSDDDSIGGKMESDPELEKDSDDSNSGEDPPDPLLAELLREASQSESDTEDDKARANDKGAVPPDRSRNKYEVPAANIAVLMLACWNMRLPVTYIDLIKLIEEYTLPYLDPMRLLPPEMSRHLAKETVLALSPHFPPSVFGLHVLTSRLARLCWSNYGIHTPEANVAPLLWRAVRALCGSSTLYALTKTIANVLGLPLTLHPSLAPALVQAKGTDPRRHKSDNIPAELALVGATIVVLKLVYGLDGTTRHPVDPADVACALPCFDDYIARLRDAAPGPELFSATRHAPATDLDDRDMDSYLAFCERVLLGNSVPDKTVADFFPLSQNAEADNDDLRRGAVDGRSGKEEDGRGPKPRTLRPSAPATGGDVVQPGSVVRVYNTLDVLGTVPSEYATVLETGARAVGVGVDDVGRVVEVFERRLVRWAERQKRTETKGL